MVGTKEEAKGMIRHGSKMIQAVTNCTVPKITLRIGAAFGALIFGTVSMGIYYTDVDTDWFKVFLGVMMLIAVIFNNFIRRRVTENK